MGTIIKSVGDAASSVGHAVESAAGAAEHVAEGVAGGIAGGVKGVVTEVNKAVTSTLDSVVKGIGGMTAAGVGAAQSGFEKALPAIQNLGKFVAGATLGPFAAIPGPASFLESVGNAAFSPIQNALQNKNLNIQGNLGAVHSLLKGAAQVGVGLAAENAQVGQLKGQLAEVDVEIKELMNQMGSIKNQEEQVQDKQKSQGEVLERLNNNLEKAANSYSDMNSEILKMFRA